MRKTQRTDALRLIRYRKAAFLTLCLIIALGLGGFFATQYAARGIQETIQNFYDQQHFWDFQMISSIGAAPEDVKEVQDLPNVAEAEGVISTEGVWVFGNSGQTIQTISLTDRVSIPSLLSGRLPEKPGECAVAPDLLEICGASVGEFVELQPPDGSSAFQSGRYLITGTIYHPDYLRRDSGYAVVLVPEDFRQERFSWIAVLVAEGTGKNSFSDSYFQAIAGAREDLKRLSETLHGGLPSALAEECGWIVLDRRSNIGYINYSSQAGAYSGAGTVFGSLFLLVTGLECYSTVAVIVEEEKRTVGIAKAFGFHRSEVLYKYLMFGIGAAFAGSALGIAFAFGLSHFLLGMLARTGLYAINVTQPVVMPLLTVAVCIGTAALCAGTAAISCLDLLKSPAELLLKGTVASREKNAVRVGSSRRTGLYFRMILRNMKLDRSRVALSVGVVAVCCMLIGISITIKLAHDGSNYRQLSDVLLYDLKVETGENISREMRTAMDEKLDALGVEWCPAIWETRLFENGDGLDSTIIVCADTSKLERMIGMTDPTTGEKILPDDEGILVQYRIAENLHLSPGDVLTVLDRRFNPVDCRISGYFINYAKRMLIMSSPVYDKAFGTGSGDNVYLVRLNGVPETTLRDELLLISDRISFERADSFFEQFRSISFAYRMIVLAVIGIAILISFVILINLAKIYLAKKKRELIILRLNGFSVRMAKAYVAYEVLFITVVGLVLGVVAGIPLARVAVRVMEREYFQFVRDVQSTAWIIAVLVEAGFSVLIYSFAMRKIRTYEIGDLDTP